MPKPSLGGIVQYMLNNADATAVNRRRSDGARGASLVQDGTVVHSGNAVTAGDVYAMVIVRVWNEDPGTVNGQVLLDGNDTLWVTSIIPGDGMGQYFAAGD
jgi:hypothetical protein